MHLLYGRSLGSGRAAKRSDSFLSKAKRALGGTPRGEPPSNPLGGSSNVQAGGYNLPGAGGQPGEVCQRM